MVSLQFPVPLLSDLFPVCVELRHIYVAIWDKSVLAHCVG